MKLITSIDQLTEEERLGWMGHDYSIDVETTGLLFMSDTLIGVALYINDESYYFVLSHANNENPSQIDEYLTLSQLQMILNPVMTQSTVACLHNSKFDRHFFRRFGLILSSKTFDTLIAAQLLDENRRNGLKNLAPLVSEIEHVKYAEFTAWDIYPKGCPYNVPLEPFAEYAMKDVIITHLLWQKFREELAKEFTRGTCMQDVFNKVYMPMVGVLVEIEEAGFSINQELAQELYDRYALEAEENKSIVQKAGYQMLAERPLDEIPDLYWKAVRDLSTVYFIKNEEVCAYEDVEEQRRRTWEELYPMYTDKFGVATPVVRPTPRSKLLRCLEFNVGSQPQLIDLILKGLDLPDDMMVALTTTPKGGDSVNFDNLMIIKYYLADDTPHYVDALLKWRKASKFVTTYLTPFLNNVDEDHRLHCTFSMVVGDNGRGGTATGRLSSSNINLQNIPSRFEIGKEARQCFVSGPGRSLIVADYSNMETVIQAHFSRDPVLLKAFSEGLDVHALTACGQHNIPYDKFIEEYKNGNLEYDIMRRVAKTTLFGTAYGMGVIKFQRLLLVQNSQEFSYEEVQEMLKKFNETYEGLTEWKKGINAFAGKHGYVPTILGRKRRLPNVFSNDRQIRARAMRQGVNAVVQGSCADILFQAMTPIQATFKSLGGSLIASVHDELVGELPDEFAEVGAHLMQTLMVDLINPILRCKLSAQAHIGKNWYDAKHG